MNRPRKSTESFKQYRMHQTAESRRLAYYLKNGTMSHESHRMIKLLGQWQKQITGGTYVRA